MKKILIINNERDSDDFGWIPIIKEAILKIREYEFEVLHHKKISREILEKINPDYIYLTGRVTYDWDLEEILADYKNEIEMIKATNIPILGVCAGHQLIAIAYGASFGKMVEVEAGEEDIRETDFTEIEIKKYDKIFEGFENKFTAYELHRDEVKSVPEEFDLLASTEMCKIQAMKHKKRNLYSVQFHPEKYNDENKDGKIILENFLKL